MSITLWDKALPESSIPAVPSYSLVKAKGGETTYELDLSRIERSSPRNARPGELLRDPNLMYIPDYTENIKHRLSVGVLADGDPHYQEVQKILCKSSILYFTNTFVYTIDPRLKYRSKRSPFVAHPKQEELLRWLLGTIWKGIDGVGEKSRDMGASWIAVIVACWLCLFYDDMSPHFMSMTETQVDDRTATSLLGKCRDLLTHMPTWMLAGWSENGKGVDVLMEMKFPETQSSIKGILSRSTVDRGGRAAVVFCDEFAFVENSEKVISSLGDHNYTNIFISTANGGGNAFYRMAHDKFVNKIRMHWTDHPLKNKAWKIWRLADPKMTEQIWNSEHEIDYKGSAPGRVYPRFVSHDTEDPLESTVNLRKWVHARDDELVQYHPGYPVFTGQDYGMNDFSFIVFFQLVPSPPEYHLYTKTTLIVFDEFCEAGETVDGYRYLLNSKGYSYRHHVGDARTGNARDSLGQTWIKNFRREVKTPVDTKNFGIILPGSPVIVKSGYFSESDPITTMQNLISIPGAFAVNENTAPMVLAGFQNWSYPTEHNEITGKTEAIKNAPPNHDDYSHPMKAACYYAHWSHLNQKTSPTDERDWPFAMNQARYI